MHVKKSPTGPTLTAVWTPEAMKEMEADFERHASEAVVVTRNPNQCAECWREGDQRAGCACLAPTAPVIDLFTRERIR